MLPRGTGSPARIMCVNCNICFNNNTMRRYHVLELDTRVTSIICNWIHPQIISEDHYVCEACRDLAIRQVNDNLAEASDNQQAGPSHRGHCSVCLLCGSSILRRQSDMILQDNPSDLHLSMIEIIQSRVAPRQFVIYVIDSFVSALIYVQTLLEMAQMNNGYSSLRTTSLLATMYIFFWILKDIALFSQLCYEIENFYMKITEVDVACAAIMRKDRITGATRSTCKDVILLNRVAFRKLEVCGWFAVDARLPLALCGNIASYSLVLLQFALNKLTI